MTARRTAIAILFIQLFVERLYRVSHAVMAAVPKLDYPGFSPKSGGTGIEITRSLLCAKLFG